MEDGGLRTEEGLIAADSDVLSKASFKFSPVSDLFLLNRLGVASGVFTNSTKL